MYDKALGVVRNKWFWIILGSVVILWLVWRNWYSLKSLFGQVKGDYQGGTISPNRQAELKSLAKKVYDAIYSPAGAALGGATEELEEVNAINDTELEFLAKYYKDSVSQNSLCKDIDDEFLPYTTSDDSIIKRLTNLKLC